MLFVPVPCSVLCKGESVSPYPQELQVSGLYLLSVQCLLMLVPTSRAVGSLLASCSPLCKGRYPSLLCCEQNPQNAKQILAKAWQSWVTGFVESSAVGLELQAPGQLFHDKNIVGKSGK